MTEVIITVMPRRFFRVPNHSAAEMFLKNWHLSMHGCSHYSFQYIVPESTSFFALVHFDVDFDSAVKQGKQPSLTFFLSCPELSAGAFR